MLAKTRKWSFLILGLVPGFLAMGFLTVSVLERAMADVEQPVLDGLEIVQGASLLPTAPNFTREPQKVWKVVPVVVTAYSSSVWETSGDPFLTASETRVRDGVAANNLLPFGTKIRLPQVFGDKVFVIEDRMHSKKGDYHVDIWFSSRAGALKFGARLTEMEVLNY